MRRIVILLGLAACTGPGPPAAAAEPPSVARPKARDEASAAVTTPYVGVIAAGELMDATPLVQGVIANVRVRPGDRVKAGDVLVEMTATSMEEEARVAGAAATAARAALTQADVDVRDALRKLALETWAVGVGISPSQNLPESQLGVERARAAAARAAATLAAEQVRRDIARDRVAETVLRARFDGVVQLRLHDAGATVQAGQAIVRIVGTATLRLRFAVPAERARTLPPGTKLTATVETIPMPIRATVSQVSPALDPASGMVLVEAELSPDDTARTTLRHGLAAWVQAP